MAHLLTCMGEILIDFLPQTDDSGTTTGFSLHPGGAPFNVAVGVARLGQPVAFLSKMADDFFGRYLRRYMQEQGITTDFVLQQPQGRTTLAFVATEAGEPVYTFYNTQTADTLMDIHEFPPAVFSDTSILHCVGSVSMLGGTTPDAVLSTAARLKGKALISFDPNVRAHMLEDEQRYRERLNRMLTLADVVKVSAADLGWLRPAETPEAVALDLIRQGVALVVVTRGSQGVLAFRGSSASTPERWHLPSFPVQVVDTVGAGDSFSGGMLASLVQRSIHSREALLHLEASELEHVLQYGAAVSAITCTRAGANPPDAATVAALLQRAAPDQRS